MTDQEEPVQEDKSKKLSPAFFAFALFCFVLPFVTISCPGGKATLSGYELLAGTEIEGEEVSGEIVAVLAFLAALAALAMSFAKTKEALTGAGTAGAAGAGLLLILRWKISKDVAEETGGMAIVSYDIGYWLALLALVAGAAFCFYLRSRLTGAKDFSTEKSVAKPRVPPSSQGVPETERPGGP